jgi:hypothetical protein
MYGLKNEIDLCFLNGREVIQVAVGLYHTSFGFDEDVAISVEAEFRYFDGQAEWTWRPEPGSSVIAARTVALFGATIKSFESNTNGTLALVFSNGHRLTISDPSQEYESYTITRPGRTIVV